jgi:hypothetical protein
MSIKNNKVESKVGQVVHVYGRDERIMSDVWEWITYAVFLNADGTYGSESGCGYYGFTAEVDAPAEQVEAYKAKLEADRIEAARKQREYEAAQEAMTPRNGKTVRVVRGRNVPVGTEGKLFWMGETKWGRKVGIALDDSKDGRGRFANVAWTYLHNIEVVIPQKVAAVA